MKFQALTVSLSAFADQKVEMASKNLTCDLRRPADCPKLRRFSDVLQIKTAQKNVQEGQKNYPVHQKHISDPTDFIFGWVLIGKSGVRARIRFQSHFRKHFSDI